MNRKEFVRGVASWSALGGFWAGFASHNPLERFRSWLHSDDTVPRRLDCRINPDNCHEPIKIFRHGRELEHVVAYDLDDDWVEVLRMSPADEVVTDKDGFVYDRLSGGVRVRWDTDEVRRRKNRRSA